MVMLCLAPVFFTLLLENDWSGYLLAIVCLIAAQIIARSIQQRKTAITSMIVLVVELANRIISGDNLQSRSQTKFG